MREFVLKGISRLYESEVGGSIDPTKLSFIDDELVSYEGKNITLPGRSLIPFDAAEPLLRQFAEGGPSWIHFHQAVSREGDVVVTIRRGALIGAANPSINTSLNKDCTVTRL